MSKYNVTVNVTIGALGVIVPVEADDEDAALSRACALVQAGEHDDDLFDTLCENRVNFDFEAHIDPQDQEDGQ